MKKIHLLSLILILAIVSCTDSATDRVKQGNKLQLQYSKGPYTIGADAMIKLSGTVSFDSVYLNGIRHASFESGQKEFSIPLKSAGSKSYTVKAYTKGEEQKATITLSAYPSVAPVQKQFEIVKVLEHDPTSYTQGYEIHNGYLYESRGQYGESGMRKLKFYDTKVDYEIPLPPEIFGEGLTIIDDLIYQLTWKSRKCYVYKQDMQLAKMLTSPMAEGWGLCNDGESLYASDGSHLIYKLDKDLNIQNTVAVFALSKPLQKLNELEYVKGKIYANIYTTDEIVSFDPNTGVAETFLDLSSLRTYLTNPKAEVLNGIAYVAESDEFLVTGKYWDKAFIIKIL